MVCIRLSGVGCICTRRVKVLKVRRERTGAVGLFDVVGVDADEAIE
jgi:hypothetical protein